MWGSKDLIVIFHYTIPMKDDTKTKKQRPYNTITKNIKEEVDKLLG